MRVLIDTHAFLWFIEDNPKLSPKAADLMESNVDLLMSTASLWEIAIKVNLKKLTLAGEYDPFISQQVAVNNIQILPIAFEHLSIIADLPLHHRDPFDRLLIAQASVEGIQIISADSQFDNYGVNRFW